MLLSGGIDSTTLLVDQLNQDRKPQTITFDYGQWHTKEISCAKSLSRHYKTPNMVQKINLPLMEGKYVPARNTVFLAYASAWAEKLDIRDIFIGVCKDDWDDFPDTRRDYIFAFQGMINLGIQKRVKIQTPYIFKTKQEIMEIGNELGIDYSMCWTDKI